MSSCYAHYSPNTKLLSLLSLLFVFACVFSPFSAAQDDSSTMTELNEMTDETETAVEEQAVDIVSARYFCELQGLTRRVEIDYEASDSSVPCSVNYYKDTEAPGEVNTLWNATNVEGYCEEKAAGFIEKLKSWGWSCREG